MNAKLGCMSRVRGGLAALVEEGTGPEVGCDFDAKDVDEEGLRPPASNLVGDAVIAAPDPVKDPLGPGVDDADTVDLEAILELSALIPKPISPSVSRSSTVHLRLERTDSVPIKIKDSVDVFQKHVPEEPGLVGIKSLLADNITLA